MGWEGWREATSVGGFVIGGSKDGLERGISWSRRGIGVEIGVVRGIV